MTYEICGDNRFEIIEKAKRSLIESTNIETSEDEMKVIDDFLFRCWQMGWLDKYDNEQPLTIPCFAESEEAYKAWTGEEIGGGRLIDKHILMEELQKATEKETSPTIRAGLIKAQRITHNAPTVSADRPHGEWEHNEEVTTMDGLHWHVWRCTNCNSSGNPDMNYCPNCGAKMGGDGE